MAHNLSDIRRQVEARVAQEEAEHGTGPEQEAHDREGARGLRLIPMDELLAEPRVTDWLIRDYFERATLACLFGLSGTMKSFVALDVGLSIAAGLPWQGCRVKQGPVIYVAGEGFGGLSKRIKVWTRQHDVSGSIPFYVSDRAVAVLDPDSMADAQAAIDALAGQVGNPALVIVDTVARNFGPGNENATPDMSAFVAGLDALKSRYGCAVLAVHHTGLTAQERGRGSYALHAGLDYEFRLEVQGDIRVLSAEGQGFRTAHGRGLPAGDRRHRVDGPRDRRGHHIRRPEPDGTARQERACPVRREADCPGCATGLLRGKRASAYQGVASRSLRAMRERV